MNAMKNNVFYCIEVSAFIIFLYSYDSVIKYFKF